MRFFICERYLSYFIAKDTPQGDNLFEASKVTICLKKESQESASSESQGRMVGATRFKPGSEMQPFLAPISPLGLLRITPTMHSGSLRMGKRRSFSTVSLVSTSTQAIQPVVKGAGCFTNLI